MGGIWGQTRSYGDKYHWAFHDGTVESLSAVSVFFSGGREPGAGDEVEADISQPGGAELYDAHSDEFGHLIRKYSDSDPMNSDSCRSVATLSSYA